MDRNILLTIAYDGSAFHGWQRQPGVKTVQGHLEQTFSSLFGREITLAGTSRTDAGVHALGQRASLRGDISIPEERLVRVLNNALCGREDGYYALSPVRILEARDMPEGFHARFDSKGKKYVYRIRTSEEADIFRRNHIWHIRRPLDTEAMRRAAEYLVGTHDFRSFESAGGNAGETTVRTVFSAKVLEGNDEVRFEISGDGFLYNMVRIITGTLAEIGAGKRAPEEMKAIIEAADRAKAGRTAPPYGLYLMEVYYGETPRMG